MGDKAQQEKLVARLRAFARSAGKVCADCTEKGPGQICMDFNTFICMTCSGIHREFQHKCKGISMSKWTTEEVKQIEAGGNAVAQSIWMARWDPSQFPIPEAGDRERVRKFIELKYVKGRWHADPDFANQRRGGGTGTARHTGTATAARGPHGGSTPDLPPAEPISKILNEEPKLVVNKAPSSRTPPTQANPAPASAATVNVAALSSGPPRSQLPQTPRRKDGTHPASGPYNGATPAAAVAPAAVNLLDSDLADIFGGSSAGADGGGGGGFSGMVQVPQISVPSISVPRINAAEMLGPALWQAGGGGGGASAFGPAGSGAGGAESTSSNPFAGDGDEWANFDSDDCWGGSAAAQVSNAAGSLPLSLD